MFCDSCGTKNRENAQFCVKCGQKLMDTMFEPNELENTDAGIRKTIKLKASKLPKGKLCAGFIILFLLLLASTIFFYFVAGKSIWEEELPLSLSIIMAILNSLIYAMLVLGILNVGFKVSRNAKVKFKDIFMYPLEHPRALVNFFLILIIFDVISVLFIMLFTLELNGYIYLAVYILMILMYIYIYPLVDMMGYILADSKQKPKGFIKTLKAACKLVKGRRKEYYGLVCSFIPWHLLGILTLGILYIWLYPYIILSKVNLYKKWKQEEIFESRGSGISNEAIIGISVGGIIAGIVVTFVTTVAIITAINPEWLDEEEKTIILSGEAHLKNDYAEITFKVPEGYEAVSGNTYNYQEFADNYDGSIV